MGSPPYQSSEVEEVGMGRETEGKGREREKEHSHTGKEKMQRGEDKKEGTRYQNVWIIKGRAPGGEEFQPLG